MVTQAQDDIQSDETRSGKDRRSSFQGLKTNIIFYILRTYSVFPRGPDPIFILLNGLHPFRHHISSFFSLHLRVFLLMWVTRDCAGSV